LAAPNLYGDDPAVQVSPEDLSAASPELVETTKAILVNNDVAFKAIALREGRVIVRFADSISQLKASDTLRSALNDDYVVALNLAPRTPDWMRALGLQPMNLGLDLRGGVHFRLEVDVQAAVTQALERYAGDIRDLLRENDIRYSSVSAQDGAVEMHFRNAQAAQAAADVVSSEYLQLAVIDPLNAEDANTRLVRMTEARAAEVKNFAVEQNITTLRNRVNELGVAEPLIQRQGQSSIVVELPGVQDTARAKEILGSTATLEFRLVDTTHNAQRAAQTGRIPLTTELYYTTEGRPVLLKRDVIVSGNQLVDALATIDQQSGGPAVSVTLDSAGAREMGETTAKNLNKPMAVLFIENKVTTEVINGEEVKTRETNAEIISVATINGIFSKRFIITGLEQAEAAKLALLLRAGALATPVEIVGERTISPSLGQDNIERGRLAVVVGFLLVIAFMAIYYRVFGLIADVALAMNLVMIVALMSLIQATLTMPGIAGIVLTVGMAVDANVLIFERIREELRRGVSPQAAISAGYENAMSSIVDGNITTMVAALVLFIFGSGPVKGFAIVLVLGLATSMFTAIMGTRAITNFVYGGRRVKRLSI
ncbi:MAG TPA: protein translocase subunit SecD, partial [Gammaproteobacteria bacterium]|nr:protein translocase subunit SecD [Gammaproteobacteria bacterium]